MDEKFHRAMAAIKAGDLDELESLVSQDPTLATTRSATSHPTLLQCLALDARDATNKVAMAKVLRTGRFTTHPPAGLSTVVTMR
ncbi:MAG TPA: hypothetical protein VJH03_14380 [Blastocatellia bacterium]|nr:hypothetical protein [Blastocatellia bacterium]